MKRALVAVPLVALALLTGCGTPSGGAAAAVNGSTVSLTELDRTTEACMKLSTEQRPVVRTQAAQMLLNGLIADALAARQGLTVTPAMENAAIKKLGGSSLPTDTGCGHAIRGTVALAAVADALGRERFASSLKSLDVQLNPRIGHFDAATSLVSSVSGSLSREALPAGALGGR